MSAVLRETPYTFGADGRLFGILTRPEHTHPERPVVIIPNTGVEHRVGPNRLHVQLARALAAGGFEVLRFDIAGLGDSDPPRGQRANANDDLREAVASLAGRASGRKVALVGLCSGAHDIHQFAKQSDTDIAGLMFIDGYNFPTPEFKRRLLTGRLAHPVRAMRKLFGLLQSQKNAPQGVDTDFIEWPDEAEVRSDYTRMLARKLPLAFVFTGDRQWAYLYRDQHTDAFPMLKDVAQVWFLPHIDHTLTRRKAREELVALIRNWLQQITG